MLSVMEWTTEAPNLIPIEVLWEELDQVLSNQMYDQQETF